MIQNFTVQVIYMKPNYSLYTKKSSRSAFLSKLQFDLSLSNLYTFCNNNKNSIRYLYDRKFNPMSIV